jgi:hypothetical protein
MSRSVLQVNPFLSFLQSCRSVCNHPMTQTSRIRRIKKDLWRRIERLIYCMKCILLAICASDDAISPSWEEELLNQKCQSIAPDPADSLPYLDEMKSMIMSVLRAKEFRSFLHRCSNPVCNHPQTQEEATRIYEEGLRDWEDCMQCTLLQICAIGDAIIPSWEEEVLNQKCN